ncbi:hypothetical protein CCACVL1_08539, partial [Corchorus capsularis]
TIQNGTNGPRKAQIKKCSK